ncbi:MAG: OPT family oligopeptide transporter [Candidatus Obscuribacterales bacterium]
MTEEIEKQEQEIIVETPEQVPAESFEDAQKHWLENVYQGDDVPQLTVRAVLMGGFLGALMSISNLYTTLKVGWSFGVAITACVLSFVIWRTVRLIVPGVSQMTILENNCMQSTASAAGYSTGATIGTAFGALLLITGVHIGWQTVLPWTLVTAALGVFLAVPMKRQMINRENLAFPSGIAAAETLKSLYGKGQEAVRQAYALVATMGVGALVGLAGKGEFAWQYATRFKLPEMIPFGISRGALDMSKLPGFGFEPSILLIGAGMIVGLRVSTSMLLGASLLYFVIGPHIIAIGQVDEPGRLLRWALWPGTALLVASGLTAFAMQWRTVLKAMASVGAAVKGSAQEGADPTAHIEVPTLWLVLGLVPLTIFMIILQFVAFKINVALGLLSVVMSFFLALVACRATGETDITPIGAMGKITQLTYAVLAPSNITTNLMAASVTANIAISSADLLTDLKSGYLLGANARKQFIAQFIGVFFGCLAIVPAWYLMVPDKAALDKFNPPAANMWRAVAEALSNGIHYVPETARTGMVIAALLGIGLTVAEAYAPPRVKKFLPSSMGLGLSWVVVFANSLSFFIGAVLALIWSMVNSRNASTYTIPVASGAVAGESLMCAIIAMITAASALGHH